MGKIVPSWGNDGGDTRRTPGLVLIVSGTLVFVGVVTVEGKGDLGVPGVFGVGVVGIGDMGLEPISCPASKNPVLLPPSLLPDLGLAAGFGFCCRAFLAFAAAA